VLVDTVELRVLREQMWCWRIGYPIRFQRREVTNADSSSLSEGMKLLMVGV
jgi:hypothetical protein